jgi:hypothetical protein
MLIHLVSSLFSATVKIEIIFLFTPMFSIVGDYKRFGGAYCLHIQCRNGQSWDLGKLNLKFVVLKSRAEIPTKVNLAKNTNFCRNSFKKFCLLEHNACVVRLEVNWYFRGLCHLHLHAEEYAKKETNMEQVAISDSSHICVCRPRNNWCCFYKTHNA